MWSFWRLRSGSAFGGGGRTRSLFLWSRTRSRKSWWTRVSWPSSGWKVAASRWPSRTRTGSSLAGGEGFDVFAGPGDAGGADEDHLERAAGEFGFGVQDGGVDLAAVGVALDGDVEGSEGLLGRVGDVLCEQDDSGAGPEGRGLVNEVFENVEEAALLEELEHGGGLAAGHDEAVDSFEVGGEANQLRGGAKTRRVFAWAS